MKVEIGDIVSCEFQIGSTVYKGTGKVANIEYVNGQKRCYAFWKWNDGKTSYGFMREEDIKIIKKHYEEEKISVSSFSMKEVLQKFKEKGIQNKYIQELEKKYGN